MMKNFNYKIECELLIHKIKQSKIFLTDSDFTKKLRQLKRRVYRIYGVPPELLK